MHIISTTYIHRSHTKTRPKAAKGLTTFQYITIIKIMYLHSGGSEANQKHTHIISVIRGKMSNYDTDMFAPIFNAL